MIKIIKKHLEVYSDLTKPLLTELVFLKAYLVENYYIQSIIEKIFSLKIKN